MFFQSFPLSNSICFGPMRLNILHDVSFLYGKVDKILYLNISVHLSSCIIGRLQVFHFMLLPRHVH